MSRYDTELEVMAEGLHPKDIVWLEKRVEALEKALEDMIDPIDPSDTHSTMQNARAVLSEGDASGGWPEVSLAIAEDTLEGDASGG